MTATAILATSGIYSIRNAINGKVYVGSAVSIESRFKRHLACLRGGKHHSLKLQRAWDKYGQDAFLFEAVEIVPIDKLLEREQYWIDKLGGYGDFGYNMIPNAASHLGAKRSAEARARMGKSNIGRKHTPEAMLKIIDASRNRPPLSAEARAKISASNTGKKRSQEAISRMVAAQRMFIESGRRRAPITEETRLKLSTASKGKRHTDESKAKMSAIQSAIKRKPLTEDHKKKIGLSILGIKRSEETKEKLSKSIRSSDAFARARKNLTAKRSIRISIHGIEYESICAALRYLHCGRPSIMKLIDAGFAKFL